MAIPRTSPAKPPITYLSTCARRSDDTDARNATVRRFGRSDRSGPCRS
jgi:hypothetical protein